MLLEELESFPENVKEQFRKVANLLICNSFLAKDKQDNANNYYFVINYKKYFDELFSYIGYELIINQNIGAIELDGKYSYATYHLKKEETILVLILRMLYQEKLIDTALGNTVQITIDEIHQKYDTFDLKKKKLNKTSIIDGLRLFKKYNLLDNLGDLNYSSTKLLIFSTITLFIPVENIMECYTHLYELENGKEEEENEKIN